MKSLLNAPLEFYREIVAHLSNDQQDLEELLRGNGSVAEVKFVELIDFDFQKEAKCDLDNVEFTFVPKADGRIVVAFYPEEEDVQLSDFVLTELQKTFGLDDIPTAFTVPTGRLICAFDLGARLRANLTGSTSMGAGNLSFFAKGGVTAGIQFFKLLDANRSAKDAIVDTASSLKTFFQAVSQPPGAGEIVVTEFASSLSFGAEIGYGFAVGGTKSFGLGFEDVTLQSEYRVKAKGGAKVKFRLERDLVTVVRPTGLAGWVNVSYLKKRGSDAEIALNLSVDAKLSSAMISDGKEQEAGALIDMLLAKTTLPHLMGKLEGLDTSDEIKSKGDEFVESIVRQVSSQLRDVLEDPVAEVDQFLEPIRRSATGLVENINSIDEEVSRFLESATERVDALKDIDTAMTTVEESSSAEDLLVKLSGKQGADIQRVLAIFSETLNLDLSQVSWLETGFTKIKGLAQQYQKLNLSVRNSFEEQYRWLKLQLEIDDAIALLKRVSDATTLQEFLDTKVVWLEHYLAKRLGTPVNRIAESLEPALVHANALTSGYDKLVGKARNALERSLNREISFQASLAWQRVSMHQALVSVDVNLDEPVGRAAMEHLLHGRIGDVLLDRLTEASSIRIQKSYFLDQIRSSVSLKLVVNGRERMNRRGLLTSTKTLVEPTSSGEIWVQESAVETRVYRKNRRAILNVNTLFEVSLQELFKRQGDTLTGQGLQLQAEGLRYNYTDTLRGNVRAAAVRAQLQEVTSRIDFEVVPPDDYDDLCEGIEEIGRLGDLGEPTIDIDVGVSRDALAEIFSESSTEEVHARVREAYSRAVQVAFADYQRVIAFYEARKDTGFDVSDVKSARWGIRATEQMMAKNITNSYATFSNQLADIHRHVFRRVPNLGGYASEEELAQRTRLLLAEMRRRLRKLGKKMSWINRIQPGDRPRDFTMAIFVQMIDPSDRSGSIAVHYNHPISKERLTLRVDDIVGEVAT